MKLYRNVILFFFAAFSLMSSYAVGRHQLLDKVVQSARIKRDHGQGITGPVHTYVKTDKHANFKWGVRHHVGKHYSGN